MIQYGFSSAVWIWNKAQSQQQCDIQQYYDYGSEASYPTGNLTGYEP
ncbi:MAG: hypothetical protein NC131_19245 [Roseburia sp.]|nr:hypothetical protein [Roseburia sp.]